MDNPPADIDNWLSALESPRRPLNKYEEGLVESCADRWGAREVAESTARGEVERDL